MRPEKFNFDGIHGNQVQNLGNNYLFEIASEKSRLLGLSFRHLMTTPQNRRRHQYIIIIDFVVAIIVNIVVVVVMCSFSSFVSSFFHISGSLSFIYVCLGLEYYTYAIYYYTVCLTLTV